MAQELMNLADMMYTARNQLKEWSNLSAEREEIVALNAKITQLEQKNKSRDKSTDKNKNKSNSKNEDKKKFSEWMKEQPKWVRREKMLEM